MKKLEKLKTFNQINFDTKKLKGGKPTVATSYLCKGSSGMDNYSDPKEDCKEDNP
jgi:hypothetical protein